MDLKNKLHLQGNILETYKQKIIDLGGVVPKV
jgi:hypothetical protein